MAAHRAGAGDVSQVEFDLPRRIKLELSHSQPVRDEPARSGGKCANEAKSPPASTWLSCARRSPKRLTLTRECRANDDVNVVADERH
jgi:hypothetical protein